MKDKNKLNVSVHDDYKRLEKEASRRRKKVND
jgi:hypothetical protein